MIRYSELRIGNWVYSQTLMDYARVSEVNQFYAIVEANGGTARSEKNKPIDLTPDLLQTLLGFIKHTHVEVYSLPLPGDDFPKTYLSLHAEQCYLENDPWSYGHVDTIVIKRPKYLHELQNLIFSVSGQELEITL